MIKFAMAGTAGYLDEGVIFLGDNGYIPELIIREGSVKDREGDITGNDLELLVCLAHPNILTESEIALFPKGCINFHTGLPDYRGRHPLNWMIIDGLKEIPVAVHYMVPEIDEGDVIVQDFIPVERHDDYGTLVVKIQKSQGPLLLSAIKQIENDCVHRVRQPEGRYTKKRTPTDSKIDWSRTSEGLTNFVRALGDPMPSAFAETTGGEEVRFPRSYRGARVGEVIAITTDGKYVVTTSDGVILVSIDKSLSVGDRFKTGLEGEQE